MRFATVVGCVAFDKAETKFAVNGESFRIFFINVNKTAAVFFYGKRKQRASQSLAKAVGMDEERALSAELVSYSDTDRWEYDKGFGIVRRPAAG